MLKPTDWEASDMSEHPFYEKGRTSKKADPCVIVIFGATGDLTARKLVPALFNLRNESLLPSRFAVVAFARRDKTSEDFKKEAFDAMKRYGNQSAIDEKALHEFTKQFYYHRANFNDDQGYKELHKFLENLDNQLGTKKNRIYYLATPPKYFPIIIEKLHQNALLYDEEDKEKWSRVIIEKPFGTDLASAKQLQKHILNFISESQIYRIDHWLGKETVQNLLVFRFANSIFESVWNANHVSNVQITVAEDMGIGTRGHLFEEQGMLRDIVQNHMMQLLSLVAMEPPINLQASSIRDEKVKVLESIRPYDKTECGSCVVRGQYEAGYINGEDVKAYTKEADVEPNSSMETYVALKLFIDNWRWSGVPFYLRAGKRLPKRATEIAITFKDAPGVLFRKKEFKNEPNVLTIRIQPNEGIGVMINTKVPGQSQIIQPVKMDFCYGSYFGNYGAEAYERLIFDAIIGDSTLFARQDEVFYSWQFVTAILDSWRKHPAKLALYPAGSWGPKQADDMIAKDGFQWRLL